MVEIRQSLVTVLKRLRLSGMLPILPDRAAYARKTQLSELEFLELALQDEIDRRDNKMMMNRLSRAGFLEEQTLEGFDWNAPVTFDKHRVRDLFSLGFVQRHEDVIFLGPAGVGKTFLASALGHAACRAGKNVLFFRADNMLKQIHQSRADNSTDKVMRSLLAPEVLIIDDFGLRWVSRPIPDSDSDSFRTPIPIHSGQRFRFIPDTRKISLRGCLAG